MQRLRELKHLPRVALIALVLAMIFQVTTIVVIGESGVWGLRMQTAPRCDDADLNELRSWNQNDFDAH